MAETQESVGEWRQATFGRADPHSPRMALRLLEEAVELAVAAGADGFDVEELVEKALERAARKKRGVVAIAKEIGDVGVTLYAAAEVYGCDAAAQIDAVMRVNRARTWRSTGDGCGQHVEGR